MSSPSSNPSSLGGGAPGIAPPLGLLTVGGSERSSTRKVLRSAWGNPMNFTTRTPYYQANSTGNNRYVIDSSLVTKFKKNQAINRNYNDPAL
jgi:hypothetical protein